MKKQLQAHIEIQSFNYKKLQGEDTMVLLPQPQKLIIQKGFLKSKNIFVKNLCSDYRIEKALNSFSTGNEVTLTIECSHMDTEGYTLSISEKEILIKGDSPAGSFYAIQTLKQIFQYDEVPCLYIEDAPDMKHRGFYHDVTRGKIPTLERLRQLIDSIAYYKMNSFQIYIEHTFPFKELGDLIDKTGYLSADEIKELDDYCYDNFIEFIPSIATFGHLYELLQRHEYKELQCLDDYKEDRVFWASRMAHHTIDPKNPKSIKLIQSLIDQYLPLFRTNKFNICCDETFDLKNGKYKDEDTGRLYIEFVKLIISYLKSKGKSVMMWGDILLQYPETISELPKDIEFLNWAYYADPKEDQFKLLSDLGCKQIVCPGTNSWSRLVESVEVADQNITTVLEHGYKFNAEGMLNTNWGDYGNPCSIELAMRGMILGASKSWNRITNPDESFNNGINLLEYKNSNATKYLSMLDQAHKNVNWNYFAWCYSNLKYEEKYIIEYPSKDDLMQTVSICQNVIDDLAEQKWERDEYRTEMLLAAEGITVIAELYAKLAGYNIARVSDTTHWLNEYRKSWLKYNKESELSEIENMFVFLEEATSK